MLKGDGGGVMKMGQRICGSLTVWDAGCLEREEGSEAMRYDAYKLKSKCNTNLGMGP